MSKLAVTFLLVAALCLAGDPFVGVWIPNAAKTKLSPGGKAGPPTGAWAVAAQGEDYRVTQTMPDGKIEADFIWHLDGKERKSEFGDFLTSGERIDERHLRFKSRGAHGSYVTDLVVSADGKTQTETRKGTGTNTGRVVDDIIFLDKRPQ
jgi:hypothetical protein